jgi:signal transduction histidine kinase
MEQLARRHDLETERPLVTAELNRRYARQQTSLRLMSWLAALLAAGTGFSILIERLRHLRQTEKMRTRFAADLHDELGANVHTIGLLSDAATVARDSDDEWQMLHQRIRELTVRTGTAIRHVSNMINADGLYLGLVEDMQRATQRIMAKFENTMETNGEEFLVRLKPRTRIDLFLFYKECLMNICRHSGATRFDTHLTASPKEIVLTISDNGTGLPGETLPASLKRRARLLKAKLTAEEPPGGGTKIILRLRNGRKR